MALKQEYLEIAKARQDLHDSVGNSTKRFFANRYEEQGIGVAGEAAFAERYSGYGYAVDTTPRPHGDYGIDFRTALGTVDVKTARSPKYVLIKVADRQRGTAKIIVQAHYHADDTVELIGWCYANEVDRGPSDFGAGIMSYSLPRRELKPMELLDQMLAEAELSG